MRLELLEKAKADRAWLMDCMSDEQEEEFRDWLMLRTNVLSEYVDTYWSRGMDRAPTYQLVSRPVGVLLAQCADCLSHADRVELEVQEIGLQMRFLAEMLGRK